MRVLPRARAVPRELERRLLRKIADILGDGGGPRVRPIVRGTRARLARRRQRRRASLAAPTSCGRSAAASARTRSTGSRDARGGSRAKVLAAAALAHPFSSRRGGPPAGGPPSSRMEPPTATVRRQSAPPSTLNGHARTFQKTDDAERRRRIRAAALARLSDSDDDEFDFSPPSAAPASTIEAPAGRRPSAALPEDAIPTTPTPEAVAAMDIRRAHSRVGALTAPTPPAARRASVGASPRAWPASGSCPRPAGSDTEPRPAASRPSVPPAPPPREEEERLARRLGSDDAGPRGWCVRRRGRRWRRGGWVGASRRGRGESAEGEGTRRATRATGRGDRAAATSVGQPFVEKM